MNLSVSNAGGAGVKLAAALLLSASLAACASSERLSGAGSQPFGTGRASAAPALPPAEPIVTSRVESLALPPPPGAAASPAPGAPAADPLFTPPPQAGAVSPPPPGAPSTPPPAPRQIETPTMPGSGGQIATLGGQATQGRGPVSSRDGVIGSWTAREATGGSCRVTLSSSPALDLYRANTSGCANRDLQRITAWDYRDGEVFLYQPGGTVAARMRVSSGSDMIGIVSRSGAGLNLTR